MDSNFGVIFKKGAEPVGNLLKFTPPEITVKSLETTNHGSGGYTEFLPTKLLNLGEMEFTVGAAASLYAVLKNDMISGTISTWTIEFPGTEMPNYSFDGFPTSIKMNEMDASSPDIQKLVIKIRPTGGIS